MKTGTQLRALRVGAGLTQSELAKETTPHGLKQPRISLIEAGEALPSVKQLAVILDAVKATPSQRLEVLRGLTHGG